MLVLSLGFVVFSVLMIVAAILAFLQIGWLRFSGADGRAQDGLPIGAIAPRWRLRDSDGNWRQTADGTSWRLHLFVDHSIAAFPELPAALRDLEEEEPHLEVIIFSRSEVFDLAEAALRALKVEAPLVAVDHDFYADHNVWAMPFALVLDPSGTVKISALVASRPDLMHAWRLAKQASSSRSAPVVGHRFSPEVAT